MSKNINHVAIIMDGNGRWATKRLKPRIFGHNVGAKNISNVVKYAINSNVKYLTLFAFSTENWNRPKSEVDFIIKLFFNKISNPKNISSLNKNNIRFKWLGFVDNLPSNLIDKINNLQNLTANNKKLVLTIAFNYGFRKEVDSGKKISSFLPDVDLLIRTGNEKRISNFILYQLAYAEIIFEKTLWPSYSLTKWTNNINEFYNRNRRFGRI